jgi:hypothetical protein
MKERKGLGQGMQRRRVVTYALPIDFFNIFLISRKCFIFYGEP